jgi:2-(1,2-epoxy-1,2-dihydrophenyl)acetyl-CoA isomerase
VAAIFAIGNPVGRPKQFRTEGTPPVMPSPEQTEQTVRYEVDGAVATITLSRPDVLNAMNGALKEALLEALIEAGAQESIRAVILTGAGRAFCVGQDLGEHAALLAAGDLSLATTVRDHFSPLALTVATMPKPVIAAVNGVAAGAGAALAFAADFRFAADDAAFILAFSHLGLAADTGASWTLQRLVGYGRATALLMLADPFSAPQALEMGLINAVVPRHALVVNVAELAARLAAGPTAAYAAVKEALTYAATSDLPAALEREAQLQARCGATVDHRSATTAFLAKQQPVFTGR